MFSLASRQLLLLQAHKSPQYLSNLILKASICHKSELPNKKVRQWPYEKYGWNWTKWIFDPVTYGKFNENSKIIQIEGNIDCGKNEFAHQLAEELGMKVIEPYDLEKLYLNDFGFDYRALNALLPERLRTCDWSMFHENPMRHSALHLFQHMLRLRMFQYVKALQHLFNTGQGVILVRSVVTERVLIDAMHELGWLPRGYIRGDGVRFYDWRIRYDYIRNLFCAYILKPHLTIYLQTPVDICLERIQNSPDPMIASSNALTRDFLQAIEKSYDEDILPRCEIYGNLLRYDHHKSKEKDEIIDIVDDIRHLNFKYHFKDTRFEDWDYEEQYLWHAQQRRLFTSELWTEALYHLSTPCYDIAGLGDSISPTDLILRTSLFESHLKPFGYFQAKDTLIKYNNPLKVILNYCNFNTRMMKHMRVDFL